MTNLLFLTPELPYPAQSGGKLKSLRLLEHLSQRFSVTLCCPLKNDDAKHLEEFCRQFPMIRVVTEQVAVKRSAVNLLRSYVKGYPLNVLRTASAALQAKIDTIIEDMDLVFMDHYEVGQFLPADFDGTVIYHGHNAYFRIWETYSQTTFNPLLKIATRLEARRVRKFETTVANRSDLVFAAPEDLTALQGSGVSKPSMAETFHLGDYGEGGSQPCWYQSNFNLIYVGFLGWEANVQGLLWFIRNVWPRLSRMHPHLKFRIVGKNADVRLVELAAKYENIELLGFVDDLDEVFADALVCVAPLKFGSGMKVKVLSAMARGIPVATTPIGAESIAAEHREHLMVARTAGHMALDIDELLTNQTLWQRLAVKSQELVADKYTWDKLFQAMDQEISSVLPESVPLNSEAMVA